MIGAGNLSNCSPDICCLCGPTIEFFGNSIGITELIVDGLPANVGIGIVSLFCLSSLRKETPNLQLEELILVLFVVRKSEFLDDDLGKNQT